jgi:hypothetical protein
MVALRIHTCGGCLSMGKQATRPGVEDLEPRCFRNHFAMVISTKGRVPSLSYAIDHVSDDPDANFPFIRDRPCVRRPRCKLPFHTRSTMCPTTPMQVGPNLPSGAGEAEETVVRESKIAKLLFTEYCSNKSHPIKNYLKSL